jgi:hypothetical protein
VIELQYVNLPNPFRVGIIKAQLTNLSLKFYIILCLISTHNNYATIFHIFHRLKKGTGRWTTKEGHRDPSKCALRYIYMNLECTFKHFFRDYGVFKISIGASPHCYLPWVLNPRNIWLRKEKTNRITNNFKWLSWVRACKIYSFQGSLHLMNLN